ncbi:DNA alkylation response protein [Xanthomonas hyacinthi]|uniref:DNA alkylation response protein n=2 Tax=Xanthomonas hyacinthi TaxID=56455 RepID=A0A2S7EZ87_9XANT|nr:acyl-CoA dehydrogenase family protein [Xanthomonas hyacinthi]KLD77888.1 acyl-CoA dehydrogenase [Xanthomonas hyacinthi DSM 19077]PPU98372.1 DNA alkylation response protein [Xanthomonas hyacinthi]QGY78998.1 DNA alkylation response protein [Xanthomonas hyacinthi]
MQSELPAFATHVVDNQPPPFEPRDLWRDDAVLRAAVAREGGDAFAAQLAQYGALAGDTLYRLGFDANRDRPRLRTHDRYGHRIDTVEFHPAYHQLLDAAKRHGVAGLSWHTPQPGAHVARAALSYLHHQAEAGTSCPLTMTHAAVAVLRQAPALRDWADKAAAPHYDPRDVPIADKAGITLGMGMTEKQGGSDVRSNATVATPLGREGEYALVGHKWFFSAPMSDGFLVLAQAPGGLSCFLLPRRLSDGRLNALRLMRLKDKLGDWSNASSEVEFAGAWAQRIGEEGRGVARIIGMVMLTRLDCMLAAAAQMRMALAQALHHARHRLVFGKRLAEQPLMRNVLADLALESEAATAFALRVARAVDAAERDPAAAAFARIATALGKYWLCKRAPAFVNEAQECLGGAGYVEESILPRLYRQAPLNSIWEGSGNIQCLDVLRALAREPASAAALLAELDAAAGTHPDYDAALDALRVPLAGNGEVDEYAARRIAERIALALQGALLLRSASPAAAAFVRSRLAGAHGLAFGTLEGDVPVEELLARALP